MPIDRLDADILELFTVEPRIGVLEGSRRLRVARGTVQARLDRLRDAGVIADVAPTVDPAALGYSVTAFVSLEIAQSRGRERATSRPSLRCWRCTPSPARPTSWSGSSPGPTPTCNG